MITLPETRWLELELADQWLTIRLNAVENRNALTDALSAELRAVLMAINPNFDLSDDYAQRDDFAVRGITLRGNGGVFCAGGDLKAFQSLRELTGDDQLLAAIETSMTGAELFWLVNQAPQVVVALVEGAAVAGGLGLACAADFVFATADATLSFSETRLGLVPAQIAPYVIARTGQQRARRMLLTGMHMTGSEALEARLIDAVAADRAELAQLESELVRDVLRCAPGAVDSTKRIMDRVAGLDLLEFQKQAGAHFAASVTGVEGREGIDAFFGKRAPEWSPDADT